MDRKIRDVGLLVVGAGLAIGFSLLVSILVLGYAGRYVSIASFIVSLLGAAPGISTLIFEREQDTSNIANQKQPMSNVTNLDGSNSSPTKSKAELTDGIQNSHEWRSAGHGSYPENLRRILRVVFQTDKIPTYRLEQVLLVLTAFGGALFIGAVVTYMSEFSTLHPILESVASIYPFNPNNQSIWFIAPIFLLFPGPVYFITKKESTCDQCGVPFAAKSLGRYYKPEHKSSHIETDEEGNEYTVKEYDGIRILECEEKGHRTIRDCYWEETK